MTDVDVLTARLADREAELAQVKAEKSSDRCQGCGGDYRFDTSVPSVVWNETIRAKGLPEYLCLSCIVQAFAKDWTSFTAVLSGDDFCGLPIEVIINGMLAKDTVRVQTENNNLRAQLIAAQEEITRLKAENENRCNVCDQPIMHELVCEDCLSDRGLALQQAHEQVKHRLFGLECEMRLAVITDTPENMLKQLIDDRAGLMKERRQGLVREQQLQQAHETLRAEHADLHQRIEQLPRYTFTLIERSTADGEALGGDIRVDSRPDGPFVKVDELTALLPVGQTTTEKE